MPYKCQCGWSSRGGVEDMLGHLRGKHFVEANQRSSHKWLPPKDGCKSYFGHCVKCDRYFDCCSALLGHMSESHAVDVQKK
mmetsp:Transcript_39299/g.111346  ORF Transcript_39299/g.111346 Transcript_39299/m.111346 type:complete len:81 (+) Transcript_39299:86-328(+)